MSNERSKLRTHAVHFYMARAFGDDYANSRSVISIETRQFFVNFLNQLNPGCSMNMLWALGTKDMRAHLPDLPDSVWRGYGHNFIENWKSDPIYQRWLKLVLLRKIT